MNIRIESSPPDKGLPEIFDKYCMFTSVAVPPSIEIAKSDISTSPDDVGFEYTPSLK